MDEPFKFEQLVQFRVPTNLSAAIEQAAKKKCQSKSDYVRQSIITRLETDGVAVAHACRDAGELYDRLSDGKARWALVADGAVLDLSYFATDPNKDEEQIARGLTWLPVSHEDSEPLDPASHWRLKPEARIDGDRVVVTYPVVEKHWEHA
jgi:hypothetical protein